MEVIFVKNEIILGDYEEEIRKMEVSMEEHHEYISKKTEFYATCQSGRR